jgi:hypothetical protein
MREGERRKKGKRKRTTGKAKENAQGETSCSRRLPIMDEMINGLESFPDLPRFTRVYCLLQYCTLLDTT